MSMWKEVEEYLTEALGYEVRVGPVHERLFLGHPQRVRTLFRLPEHERIGLIDSDRWLERSPESRQQRLVEVVSWIRDGNWPKCIVWGPLFEEIAREIDCEVIERLKQLAELAEGTGG